MQPSKFNARTSATVVEAVSRGHSLRSAAGLAGVHHQTLADWIAARPAFAAKVEEAKARFLDRLIGVVSDAIPEDPRLAERILGKKDPDGWGERTRQEVTGPEGGPVVHEVKINWPIGPTPPSERP